MFRTWYSALTAVVVYLGSYYFAWNIIGASFVLPKNKLIIILAVGFIGALANYFLYRFIAHKYHYWAELGRGSRGIMFSIVFLPPVSIFAMSVGLFVYIMGLFSLIYKNVWEQSQATLPDVVEKLSSVDGGVLSLLLFSFIFIFPIALLVVGFRKFGEGYKVKLILYPIVISSMLFILYFGLNFLKMNQPICGMLGLI